MPLVDSVTARRYFAITTEEEHGCNNQTRIWLLPVTGEPRQLCEGNATLSSFSQGTDGHGPGVLLKRETYDGVDASTKGFVDEFRKRDSAAQSLTLDRK